FLPCPPPPIFALFPFTTLFRSFCSDDRRRSSHAFADLAHPGRCTWSCRRWPDSHLPRHRLRSSVARTGPDAGDESLAIDGKTMRSEEHTSELQSRGHLVCRLLL